MGGDFWGLFGKVLLLVMGFLSLLLLFLLSFLGVSGEAVAGWGEVAFCSRGNKESLTGCE